MALCASACVDWSNELMILCSTLEYMVFCMLHWIRLLIDCFFLYWQPLVACRLLFSRLACHVKAVPVLSGGFWANWMVWFYISSLELCLFASYLSLYSFYTLCQNLLHEYCLGFSEEKWQILEGEVCTDISLHLIGLRLIENCHRQTNKLAIWFLI